VLLFVSGEDEQACGALIQAGAALATRRQVFVVSPEAWTFSHHPTCRNCSTVAEANQHCDESPGRSAPPHAVQIAGERGLIGAADYPTEPSRPHRIV